MDPILKEAFVLFGVGMVTVFTVLALVVGTGQLIISFSNRFLPEAPIVRKGVEGKPASNRGASPATIAVLSATVEVVTQGQGTIHSVVRNKKADPK